MSIFMHIRLFRITTLMWMTYDLFHDVAEYEVID